MSKILEKKIINRTAKISVVGLGYVGLPLAVSFAKSGFKVFGIDTDLDRINRVNKAISYITDIPAKELRLLRRKKKIEASTNFKFIRESDVVLICVPTPLKRKYQPDISYILNAVRKIKRFLNGPKLIILESTTYPGTTNEVIFPMIKAGGLKIDKDFYLVFSPERIDPGNETHGVTRIPKVIGGVTQESTRLARLLYKNIIKETVVVSSARVAETVKLLENTFRIVNIGLINEIAQMAHKLNINIWEVIEAAKTKPFGFMPFYPGPGVGGHCIPKDPLYLYWKARKYGFESRFIKLAAELNSAMPQYIYERLKEIHRKENKRLINAKILVVGVTYKRDVKDLRKSPALDFIELLRIKDVSVEYYDPLIPYLKIDGINLKSIKFSGPQLNKYSCVVIITDHSAIDYKFILNHSKIIFDTRNVFRGKKDERIVRL